MPKTQHDQNNRASRGKFHPLGTKSPNKSSDQTISQRPNPSPLTISGLTVNYGHNQVLLDINFTAPAGKLIGIIGPNGAGKSTLFKAVLGIIAKTSGEVTMFGLPFADRGLSRLVGYMSQRADVDWDFPVSVLDVVMMGLARQIGWLRRATKHHRLLAAHAIDAVGLAPFTNRPIGQLSGGQQQRAFLARSLVQDPQLYLLDEPLAGVDAATEKTILAILRDLTTQGKTVIVIHHDINQARKLFDYALVLNTRLVASGPVEQALTEEILGRAYGVIQNCYQHP